jgi:hypothetical protein
MRFRVCHFIFGSQIRFKQPFRGLQEHRLSVSIVRIETSKRIHQGGDRGSTYMFTYNTSGLEERQ